MNYASSLIVWLSCSVFVLNAGTWHVLIYMDSSDQLSDMALKNITEMVSVPFGDQAHLFVQLHAYDQIAYRYTITQSGLTYSDEITLQGISKYDLINAAQWAFDGHTADHTMLIIWNHGWGILDPIWNEEKKEWELHSKHKGYLCNQTSHSYLTHTDLTEALHEIVRTTLMGSPIDILAFDTCMGAMLEIAYQVAPYAHYLVGSQTCSLRDGFNYRGIIHCLNEGGSPKKTASGMVDAFDTYYSEHDTTGIYTHTALDLKAILPVKNVLDEVVALICTEPGLNKTSTIACQNAPRFCLFPMYTDLVSFIQLLAQASNIPSFLTVCKKVYAGIEQCVINRCAGHAVQKDTHGISIYLPQNQIDQMYFSTVFARECKWSTLLESLNISRL